MRACQVLRPRRVVQVLALALLDILPSTTQTASAPGISFLSRLNGWPARSPADASPTSSRMPAHGSGPMWFATPSSQWTCTTYSLPVSRRTCVKTLRGITAPGILGSTVMRRAKKRKNLSSARRYDQIRFRFHTTKTHSGHAGRMKGGYNLRIRIGRLRFVRLPAKIARGRRCGWFRTGSNGSVWPSTLNVLPKTISTSRFCLS